LAENIAKTLLKEFKKVKEVKVIVHKPKAPISLKFTDVSVEINRKR
jgi:dihydroneopterin aldolase